MSVLGGQGSNESRDLARFSVKAGMKEAAN